jgi:glycosyltransferase involved in cell wall biosynthesis
MTFSPVTNQAPPFTVNGRYRVHRVTGVQRYAHEIVNRLSDCVEVVSPRDAKGAAGHLWEQTILPAISRGRLLWSPCGVGPALYSRQVVTFHDLFPLEHPEWYSTPYVIWYSLLFRRLAKQACHLIAVSEYTKSRIVSVLGRDPESISVIHNGLATGCRRASPGEIQAAISALQLPSKRYVLSLSSLEKRKNLKSILEAWANTFQRLPEDIWLVLAGPSADRSVYGQQYLREIPPRVFFTGYVPEEHLAGLYSGALLFLYPSLAEGFGFPLLEAMACGLRCITSNTSSLPEVGGNAVFYVDPTDVHALAQMIFRFLSIETHSNGPFIPAIERSRKFSWDSAASKTRTVLERFGRMENARSHNCYDSSIVASGNN